MTLASDPSLLSLITYIVVIVVIVVVAVVITYSHQASLFGVYEGKCVWYTIQYNGSDNDTL